MFWRKNRKDDLSTSGWDNSRDGKGEKAPTRKKRRSWRFGSKNVGGDTSEPENSSADEEKTDPLQQLPDHEREILERQIHVAEAPVNYITLYRYASRKDLVLITFGGISAIIGGALLPMFTVSDNTTQPPFALVNLEERSFSGN